MKKALALASMVMLLGSVAACGGSSPDGGPAVGPGSGTSSGPTSPIGGGGGGLAGGDYCKTLQETKSEVEAMDFSHLTDAKFTALQAKLGQIAAIAPADVKGDWDTLNSELQGFKTILASAGLSFDDLQSMSSGQLPPGVTAAQMQSLALKLQQFSAGKKLAQATAAIDRNVKSLCHIDLNGK